MDFQRWRGTGEREGGGGSARVVAHAGTRGGLGSKVCMIALLLFFFANCVIACLFSSLVARSVPGTLPCGQLEAWNLPINFLSSPVKQLGCLNKCFCADHGPNLVVEKPRRINNNLYVAG